MSSTLLRPRLLQACRSPSILLLKSPPLAVSASGLRTVRRASNALQTNVATLLAQASKTATSQTDSSINRLVSVNGFIQTIRRQKRVAFAAIGDGTSLQSLQAVLSPELADGLSTGTGVTITGELRPSPGGKEQTHELHAQHVEILGEHDAAAYPLQKKYHTPEFLRTIPHLRTRLPANSLLLRLRSQAISETSKYFSEHGFIQTHPPVITSSDCEGAGEVFTVEANRTELEVSASPSQAKQLKDDTFFRMPKYLTVSTQLHLESLAMAVGKVWTLSPTFRAERSDTARHLSEFYMLEAEMAFTNQLCDVMDTVEGLLKVLSSHLQSSKVGEELLHLRHNTTTDSSVPSSSGDNVLQRRWGVLSEGNWPRITYREAINRIEHVVTHKEAFFETVPTFESGLQVEHEKFLARDVGSDGPVFVTHYPRSQKAFYMAASANNADPLNDEATVDCFDLLVPDICELVGGSLREYRYRDLVRSMNAHGMSSGGTPICNSSHPLEGEEILPNAGKQDDGPLQWYSDLRKFGSVPHGGFGIGFDRLLCYLSGMSNIRDVVAFPRWYGRCDC